MSLAEASGRTKLIYGVFVAAFAIGLALILALFVGFTGVWLDAQVPHISVLIVYVALALVVLRLALAWSMRADRR
ncbi:MAG: hypothetical protein WKF52_06490 [Sphingomicrobium sp.]